VWTALNDPDTLKACLPGCEVLERTADNEYRVVMAARVGPVSARFNGRMTLRDIDPPNGYTLQFEGQGGAAGFARGDARVALAPEGEQATALTYTAKAQVGGKLAQIGSRLVDGAAAKMTDDFFARFVERLAPKQPEELAATPASATETEAAVEPAGPATTLLTPPGGSPWVRYAALVAIVIVLIVLYMRGYR
jgi:uncharacterized protein